MRKVLSHLRVQKELVTISVGHCQHVEALVQLFLGQLLAVDEAHVNNSLTCLLYTSDAADE